jgi:hypothetical protein
MNTNGNLALAVLADISIGAVSVMAIHAQQAKTPPAYLIAETEAADRAAFQKYAEKVPETLAPFRGSFHLSSVAARLRLSRANHQGASW